LVKSKQGSNPTSIYMKPAPTSASRHATCRGPFHARVRVRSAAERQDQERDRTWLWGVVPGVRSTSGGHEKVDDRAQSRLFARGEQEVADPLELYVLPVGQQRQGARDVCAGHASARLGVGLQ